jgi:hypothetical protein
VLEWLGSWESKRARELGVNGHGGGAWLWATTQRARPASSCSLYRHVCLGGKVTTHPRYGHSMAAHVGKVQLRRGWRGGNMVGTAWPVGAWRVAQFRRSVSVTHRRQRCGARTGGRLCASACVYGDVRQRPTWNVGRRRARVRVPAQKQFRLA